MKKCTEFTKSWDVLSLTSIEVRGVLNYFLEGITGTVSALASELTRGLGHLGKTGSNASLTYL